MAQQLLKRLLKLRIAAVAQRGRKAHHRGFRNAYIFAQLRRRHEHYLIIVRNDALGNAPMTFGELLAAVIQALDQFLGIIHEIYSSVIHESNNSQPMLYYNLHL